MTLFALEQALSDFYTEGGFWVGVLGLVLGAIALRYTLVQIWNAEAAAVAAKNAAERMRAENQSAYGKFIGGFATRLLSSLEAAVEKQNWELAQVRARDLAELLASLPARTGILSELTNELRVFGQKFAVSAPFKGPTASKWKKLVLALHATLDSLNAPFGESTDGNAVSGTNGNSAPGNRTEPAEENTGR
jgi:hypothetical protein